MSPLYGTHGGSGAVSVAERNKEMNQSYVTPRGPLTGGIISDHLSKYVILNRL